MCALSGIHLSNFAIESYFRFLLYSLYTFDFLIGFNPIHLVVRQTDEGSAIPTNEHPDIESSPVHVLEETQLANAPDDFIHHPEDFPESPDALSNGETDAESLPSEEADAFSKDIGVQCDLVDVLAMLAEYQRNANDEDMSWFVSAMNMAREDTGTCMILPLIKTLTVFSNLIGYIAVPI